MSTAVPTTNPGWTIDPARHRAARDHCRRQHPDLFFASHFCSRPRRHALYALAALSHQLEEIMGPPQIGAAPPPAVVSPQAAACCSSGSCEGESIAKRQEVCLAVIDHLLTGQYTGKDELDAFVDVQRSLDIPRDQFATWITGLADERTLPRYATAKRVNDTAARSAGSLTLMIARALTKDAAPFTPVIHAQLLAWGTALRWCGLIHDIRSHVKQGRFMLPLDDLIRHQLTEADLRRFAQEGTTRNDERWKALITFEADRIRSLLRGGGKAMHHLADDGCRRTFAAVGVFALRRLERLLARGGDPFSTTVRLTTWHRLTTMPRVMKFIWDAAEQRPKSVG